MTLAFLDDIFRGDNFNSHAHVERDDIAVFLSVFTNISTHTLTWSVTATFQISENTLLISTHTLTWSVTFAKNAFIDAGLAISTHTLTWSVT